MHNQAQTPLATDPCHVCDSRGGCIATEVLNSPALRQQLHQAKRIQRKGEHVFREGDESDAFFVVRSGSIKSYLVTEDGEEQVLGFYLPGDVFGLDSDDADRRMSSAVMIRRAASDSNRQICIS